MGGVGTPERFLEGSLALVTGASRGLGKGCAMRLADHGAAVVLVGRDGSSLAAVSRAIEEHGGTGDVAVCDVTDVDAIGRVFERHSPDIVVNNAGTNVPQPLLEVGEEIFDRLVAVNLKGTFFVAQAAARSMLEAETPGVIINMSSQMGRVGAPNRSVYCATKHAVEGLTKAMAVELGPVGIRVNSVAPTFIRTPMTEPFLADDDLRRAVESQIPAGRIGEVEDVSGAVAFLASPAATLITGASLAVDGGWTAR